MEGDFNHRLAIVRHDIRNRIPFVALVRIAWDCLVRGYYGEACQVCGRRYVLWRADDALYARVLGNNRGLFCPSCFDAKARAKGVNMMWTPRVFAKDLVNDE